MKRLLAGALMLASSALAGCSAVAGPPDRPADPAVTNEPAAAPEIRAFAGRTKMTGLARTIFYGARPQLQPRALFTQSCPATERRQILGCYTDRKIFVLLVDQAELAPIMDVTAAHEMLHAAYAGLSARRRLQVDGWTTGFYQTTGSADPELRKMVESYPAAERAGELHSLLGTQVPGLSGELESYYRRYFEAREAVLALQVQSDTVFKRIESRYAELVRQIDGLAAQIDRLTAEQRAQADLADRLSGEIRALRQGGRIEESNQLVARQNAAAGRAEELGASIRALIDQHNARVEEINQLVFRQDQLVRSLGPP